MRGYVAHVGKTDVEGIVFSQNGNEFGEDLTVVCVGLVAVLGAVAAEDRTTKLVARAVNTTSVLVDKRHVAGVSGDKAEEKRDDANRLHFDDIEENGLESG